MAEFTVRVKRAWTTYADITICADDVAEVEQRFYEIENISTPEEAEWVGNGPGQWEEGETEISIAEIHDEFGNYLGYTADDVQTALEMAEEAIAEEA